MICNKHLKTYERPTDDICVWCEREQLKEALQALNQRLREIAELILLTTLPCDERETGDHADRLEEAQQLAKQWAAAPGPKR